MTRARKKAPSKRRGERVSLQAEVALRRGGQLNYTVDVFDFSRFGCKVEFVVKPAVGELVWVRFRQLEPVGAFVCWVQDHCVGLEFERPLHPAVFELLRSRMHEPVRGPAECD